MTRFLVPREHGAYAQLAFPLLSGLLMARPTPSSIGLALAAVGCFLAYEPLMVVLGIRGVRIQRGQSDSARAQLHVLTILTVPIGLLALAFAPAHARWLALIPMLLCAVLGALVTGKRVKTLGGEILVVGALASMHLAVAGAGGAAGIRLWGPALVWFSVFVLSTFAVHGIKARLKQRARWINFVAVASPIAVGFTTILLMATSQSVRTLGIALLIPLAAVEAVNLLQLHPRSLKRVGWTLVAANTLSLFVLLFL